jgi:hypothetical protein
MANGYVAFARREPHLFRFLYLERPRRQRQGSLERQFAEVELASGGAQGLREMVEQIPELKTNPVVLKSWIFVHGLASLVSSGALELPDKQLRQLLAEAGGAFVSYQQQRKESKNG